ncbi:dihydroxyacetone kinase subunit DhaL [Demequina muriae]|uniref:Dihydroxyacetone kinase subunit DhaL n=1 Tax=Demequina muriae TaxID=3051664 RepID=A0ABT8GHP8_9MICO|nr:dihydroxyacetone kinase subunit DhaL [Demequina sp. EGI L300058]MDN4480953.1 dihydroxyacetone kinase subunit DhaL [Demequina sp. EGI L300058]
MVDSDDSSLFTLDTAKDWLDRFDAAVHEHKAHLTELDSAIGDADHGSNMARGVTAVNQAVAGAAPDTLDEMFKLVGMTLVSSVGGASGPLYGTFFLRFGVDAGATESLDGAGLAAALQAGLGGVAARGKAEQGDKTMIDAMAPALESFAAAIEAGDSLRDAARAAAEAAAKGRDATEPWEARKGRASYLGERSAGHIDPGAASTTLLFEALAAAQS